MASALFTLEPTDPPLAALPPADEVAEPELVFEPPVAAPVVLEPDVLVPFCVLPPVDAEPDLALPPSAQPPSPPSA